VLITILDNIANGALTLLKIRENNIDLYKYITLSQIHFAGQYTKKIMLKLFYREYSFAI
jgi:hypothetical protein